MTVENISRSNLHKRMLPTRQGLNPQPPDQQSDEHPTEPLRPASGHKYMVEIAIMFNVQSAITSKVGKPEL